MTAIKTHLGAQPEASILPFAPTSANNATNVQEAILLAGASSGSGGADWTIITTSTTVTAVAGELHVVSGASGPITILLPDSPVSGNAVGVYMEDYSASQVATADAGVGSAIGLGGAQTHSVGGQGAFVVYRYIGGHVWVTEQPQVTRQIRFRSSNLILNKIYDNAVAYISSPSVRTVTVPAETTISLPIGYQTEIIRWDTGSVTIVADTGVTINTASSLTLPDRYSRGILTKIDADIWEWSLLGPSVAQGTASLAFTILGDPTTDGGYGAISAGLKGFIEVPFACVITRAALLADQAGAIVVDLWKDAYANYPPAITDTITASAKPTLAAAAMSQDSSLTGWVKTIAAGDIIAVNVDSAATVRRVELAITVLKV
jgi:hypothetical protein